MSVWQALFGWPGAWGTGGNLVAWVLCGGLGVGWLRAKEKAQHLAKMRQAQDHHEALLVQSAEQHQELLAKADAHHEALKEHITATGTVPPPTREGM
jgi:hypothetical protein